MANHVGSEWWRADSQPAGSDAPRASVAAAAEATASPVPFWALMGFTFILLLAPQQWIPGLAPLRIALLTAVLAITAHLYDRLSLRQPILVLTREMWIVACLVGWAILCMPLSYWPGGSIDFLFGFYFKTLAIFWLLSNVVNSHDRLRRLAWGLALMSVPLAVTAVKNYWLGVFIPIGVTHQVKRIFGYESPLAANPNDLALLLNLIIPLCMALFLANRKPLVRIALLAIIVLDMTAVILTFSRSGFVTLVMIFLTYLWKLRIRSERTWVWGALVVALACLLLLPQGYLDRLSTITNMEADTTGSSKERWRDTVSALNYVVAHPIVGAGIGMNALALNEVRGPMWGVIHNAYLEYTVELGIPGLVMFLLLLVTCIKNASLVRQWSATVPAFRELFFLAEGIQISLIAFAVAALFSPVGYNFYFYYMAGLSVAIKVVCKNAIPGFGVRC